MLLSTSLSLFFLFWSALFLIDYFLRSWQVDRYLRLVEHYGLTISPFQLRFYWTRCDNRWHFGPFVAFQTWVATSKLSRLVAVWFTLGTLVALVFFFVMPLYLVWLLFTEVFNWYSIMQWLNSGWFSWLFSVRVNTDGFYENLEMGALPQDRISYVPFQNHVQTGIIPVIPGVNIPIHHLPMFVFVLIIAGVLHELGHALAALCANVRLNGFGFFLIAIYAGAFTELDTEELNRASLAQKLRIYCAGVWHNVVLAFIGVLVLWTLPYTLFPLFTTGAGVIVKEVDKSSGLYGGSGFIPGHLVLSVNGCKTRDASEWLKCLESLRLYGQNSGYIMEAAVVDPWRAQPEFVKQYGDEIQCCEGFSNQTFSSHICFNYYKEEVKTDEGVKIENKPPVTPVLKFRESLGLGRNISRIDRIDIQKRVERSLDLAPTKFDKEKATFACLSARTVTGKPMCVRGVSRLSPDLVCVTPSLFNGTQLLRFNVQSASDVVLFVGPVTEPLYLVTISELVPRFRWIPLWLPDLVELFGQYLVTFSLALGVLNAVPCYGLDGQFICYTVIDYFFASKPLQQRNRIAGLIVLAGSSIFLLNLIIGFVKLFLFYLR
ncbi:unnamed protein product [Bursaphelenchus xylophilus]|uniref:Membrane-bound transcription factor site-2 protease n=1 Tax=Bursaphelenchus xylophilus TaxID=6326 RepID=A0A1I7SQS4_BURXY|nr:unnamed protein product [Bursaphelenchus xylophilus]CAG9110320.1 unnamed protein product [Bursaphelenchus xylophilus]